MIAFVLDDIFFAKDLNKLYWLPFLVVILYAAQGVFSYLHYYQMNYIGLRTVTRMRDELFQHLQRQPATLFAWQGLRHGVAQRGHFLEQQRLTLAQGDEVAMVFVLIHGGKIKND